MEILTYINFLAGPTEAAQTGDGINLFILFTLFLIAAIGLSLFFIAKSKKINPTLKKIISFGLPSILLAVVIPVVFASQSYAEPTSTIVNAAVDKDNGIAYIENGNIQNTTNTEKQLLVSSSQAVNAGQNLPGLQNANLKITLANVVVFNGNPFDDYAPNLDFDLMVQPGQTVQFSTELTGLDPQTSQALDGSGSSIMLRFKFYDSIRDSYERTHSPEPIGDYFYEVGYKSWNADKCNFICECIAQTKDKKNPDSQEYKNYLRREWGLSDSDIQTIIEVIKYFQQSNPYPALCTSCRHGNFIGRNFDWAYDDLDEYVIRAENNGQHNKSIGVVSSFFPEAIQAAVGMESILPMLTMDGINEYGVAVNINVVPNNFSNTTGTNPGHERLCAGVIPRFVLDNAKSAKDAINLLMDRDIYTVQISEFHFMISDATDSYIVETVNNELVVLHHTADQSTAMANFHVTNSEFSKYYDVVTGQTEVSEVYGKSSMGIERYNLAMSGLDSVNSLDSMINHMKPIYYKNVYKNWNPKNFWSDKNGMPSMVLGSDTVFSYYDDTPALESERTQTFETFEAIYDDVHADEDMNGWRLRTWQLFNLVTQTVHSSCYDIANRQLAVAVQERGTVFKFGLDTTWREGGAAKDLYVNGDNVGLATSCDVEGSRWTFSGNELQLLDDAPYSITGSDLSGITITGPGTKGRSITVPKMDNATVNVEFGDDSSSILEPAKARKGVRAVEDGSYVVVTFTADVGYTFVSTGTDECEVIIESANQDIVFGTTPGYALPEVQ